MTRSSPNWYSGARSLLYVFKVRIPAVDSAVLELVANCIQAPSPKRGKAIPSA